MSRVNRIKLVIGGLLILVGVLIAALPKDWLERSFGIEPDQGNGLLELTLAIVPIVLGVLLSAHALVTHRHQRAALARR